MSGYDDDIRPWNQAYPTFSSDSQMLPDSGECFLCDEETPQAAASQGDWEVMIYNEDPFDQATYEDENLDEGICAQDEG